MKSFANHKVVWPVVFLVFCNLLFLAIANDVVERGFAPTPVAFLGLLLVVIVLTLFNIKTMLHGNRRNS